jgi:hypothetical protein
LFFTDSQYIELTFLVEKILNCWNLSISYFNYNLAVCSIYKVELYGWPLGIKFTSPSNIGAMDEIKILYNTIKSRECTWIAMSRAQVAELVEKIKGEPMRKRATRSDKGKKHGIWGADKRKSKENVGLSSDEEEQ